jgi:hypothetical protein
MMNDCQDVTMREALPELVHGLLADAQRAAVEEHLRDCVDCTEELAILRAVLASSHAPRVDTVRIANAIPAYRPAPMTDALIGDRPVATPVAAVSPIRSARPRRRWHVDASYLRLAAAAAIAAVGISTVTLVARQHGASSADVPGTTRSVASSAAAGVALVGTADLSDAELASLIQDMNSVQALPPAEPEPMSPATDGGV